jgi:hypothetical protein
MVRQAHTYLVGAMSGATLIAIAIAFFVVLVSAQVFKDWPIAALSGGGDKTAEVSAAHPAASAAGGSGAVTAGVAGSAGRAGRAAGKPAGGNGDGSGGSVAGSDGVATAGGGQATTTEPGESATGTGGQSDGSGAAASPPDPSPSSPSGTTGSSSSSGGSGGSGGGGATSGGGSTTGPTPTPAAQVTETVNGTVAKVDETALGGTLHETGVTEVTESVVNGVAGPESTVGKVVNETVGVVGGLLGGKR